MTYPSPSDYQDALQFPEDVFADPLLAAGTPVPGPLGLPRLLTGAFAAVFPVDTAEGRKAIRCFLSDAPERRRRAEALAAHLRERPLEAFVPFAYQERGLRIGRQVLPIVVMDWVEGEGLGRYVARHHAEPATLAALAEAWTRLVDELAQARVAHGDLQPGNVLVQAHDGEPRLVLVDYDAAVVPALVGRPVPEAGHRHFQHPERGDAPADLSLDRFAALVVLTALEALQEAPALWARYDTGENLLFTAEDFFAPERSPLFAELQALPRVRPLAAALAAACYLPPDRTPTLGEARRGAVPAVRARTRRSGPREPVRRAGFARWAAPVLAAALALALLASLVQPAAGAAALAGAAVALAAWGARDYRRLPLVERRARLRREAALLGRWIADLEQRRAHVATERAAAGDGLAARRRARLEALRREALGRHLRRHFVGELDARPEVGHRAVVRLKAAGLRDALDVTDAALADVREISEESRAYIRAWRDAYLARYAEAAPEVLSPAEERRLAREHARRQEALAREAARLEGRLRVQREAQAHVQRQADALPPLTPARYAAFALRLATWPEPAARPPATPQADAHALRTQPDACALPENVPRGAWWQDA